MSTEGRCTVCKNIMTSKTCNVHALELMFRDLQKEDLKCAALANEAAKAGHLEDLKWMHSNETCMGNSWVTCAAGKGHIDILDWAYENDLYSDNEDLWMEALDRLDVIDWLHEHKCPISKSLTKWTACTANVESLARLIELGYPCDVDACREQLADSCSDTLMTTTETITEMLERFVKYSKFLDQLTEAREAVQLFSVDTAN